MRRAAPALALLTLTAAAGDSSELDKALAGRVPGTPVSCIDSSLADGPQIIDNRTLIYRGAGRLWRNTLPDACPSLTGDVILVVDVHGGQLCRNDRFRTILRGTGIPSGFCRLGDFVPYSRVKARPARPR